jgi:EPS-associated MarR family transcriptional regulator
VPLLLDLRSTIEHYADVFVEQPVHVADGDTDGARLMVLRALERDPMLSQRDLAKELRISLGKTHYLLHALLEKGLVKIRNFERSDHKLAYAYLLTPAGVREKVQLTKAFLARKEAEFQSLKSMIDDLRRELGEKEGRS